VNNTCDECQFYSLSSGICRKCGEPRHSCGSDACEEFELADDLKGAILNQKKTLTERLEAVERLAKDTASRVDALEGKVRSER